MNHEDENDFMREAIRLAVLGMKKFKGGPFGAVIVKDGEIVGRGFNRVVWDNDPSAHAEVKAIQEACQTLQTFDLSGCEIYGIVEPSVLEWSVIHWARLSCVHYATKKEDAAEIGFNDNDIFKQLDQPMEERSMKMEQMMREESMKAFDEWNKKEGKVEY